MPDPQVEATGVVPSVLVVAPFSRVQLIQVSVCEVRDLARGLSGGRIAGTKAERWLAPLYITDGNVSASPGQWKSKLLCQLNGLMELSTSIISPDRAACEGGRMLPIRRFIEQQK